MPKSELNKVVLTPEEIAKKHGVSPSMIERQLKIGMQVEKEHTSSDSVAIKIALAHLGERPDYYSRLMAMEKLPVSRNELKDKPMKESKATKIMNTLSEAMGYIVADHVAEAAIRNLEQWSDKVNASAQHDLAWTIDLVNKQLAKHGLMLGDELSESDIRSNKCNKDIPIVFFGTEDEVANLKCHLECEPLGAEQQDPLRKEGSLLSVKVKVEFVRIDSEGPTDPERTQFDNTAGAPRTAVKQPNDDASEGDEL